MKKYIGFILLGVLLWIRHDFNGRTDYKKLRKDIEELVQIMRKEGLKPVSLNNCGGYYLWEFCGKDEVEDQVKENKKK